MKRGIYLFTLAIAVLLGFALAIGSTIGQGFISPGAMAAGGAMTQIARTVLGSPAATVTFSSLGSYSHLQLVVDGRCDGAIAGDLVYLQVNGDTGINYAYQYAGGSGLAPATNAAAATAQGYIGTTTCASSLTNAPGVINFTLEDYGGTTFLKEGTGTASEIITNSFSGTPTFVGTFFWIWNSTSAITSLTVGMAGGSNWVTGSTFTLYGLQ